MIQKDLMSEWFKELPQEEPSPGFKVKVMQRVMSEWTLNPYKYQPMISRKGWWTIGFFAFVLTAILFMLHPDIPGGPPTAPQPSTIYGFDLFQLLEPVSRIWGRLNNISPAVAVGTFAILALWFFDQLFARTVKR